MPRVSDVTFLRQRVISGSLSVLSHFGSEGHSWQPVSDVTFLDQRVILGSLSVTSRFSIRGSPPS